MVLDLHASIELQPSRRVGHAELLHRCYVNGAAALRVSEKGTGQYR